MLMQFVDTFFNIYLFMIFIRILGSWIPELAQSRFMQFIAFFVDPYINIFRKIIPPLGMVDISPIAALFVLQIIEGGVKSLISHLL